MGKELQLICQHQLTLRMPGTLPEKVDDMQSRDLLCRTCSEIQCSLCLSMQVY